MNQSALMLQYAVNGLVPLFLVPHIVRTIGLHDFGLLSIALVFSNYGAIVVNYGFALSGPPKIIQAPDSAAQARTARAILFARISLTGSIIILFAVALACMRLFGHTVTPSQIVALFSLPLAACLNMTWYLQALERFGAMAICSVLAVGSAMGVAFLLVKPEAPNVTIMAAVALAIGPLLSGILTGIAGLWMLSDMPSRLSWKFVRHELHDGWPLFLSHAVAALYGSSGVLVVGLVSGATQAGAYSAAERAANAVGGACLLIHTAAYPRLASLYYRDRAQYLKHLGLVLKIYWASALVVCLAALLFWTNVQEYLFGAATTAHGWLLAATLGVIVLMIFGTLYVGYLTVAGRSREVLPLTLKLLVASLLIGIPGVWRWGATGWLVAVCASHAAVGIAALRRWRLEARLSASGTDTHAN